MTDVESIYRFVVAGRWASAMDLVHRAGSDAGSDAVRQATGVLVRALVQMLSENADGVSDNDLERLILMERAGLLRLETTERHRLVDELILRHRDVPERALMYARFAPDAEHASAVLAQFGAPESDAAGPATQVRQPTRHRTAGRGLFRSVQEQTFYKAACTVFCESLVFPNVAVSTAIDFSAITGRLLPAERSYFFKAVLDCVVFDPVDEYRPSWIFELDSRLHDDLHAATRDARKDRIVTLAGFRLHRIRVEPEQATVDGFVGLLRDLTSGGERTGERGA